MATTPADDGYAMPAEWARHARTWMCWPCRADMWGEGLARAKAAYAGVARAIARFEPVTMAARPDDAAEAVAALAGSSVQIWPVPLDDSWARDIGATVLKSASGRAAVSWRFNAWGMKYAGYNQDAAFAARVAEREGLPLYCAPLVCEGGAIHTDGQGTLLTTTQCLLNANRNPGMAREDVEKILRAYTGTDLVIWLDGEFSDVETDGHIDNIACFVKPGRVIVGVPDSRAHPDHAPAMQAVSRLKSEGFEVVELVQPRTIRRDRHGRLLQASYVNFYLCNGALVMPSFDDPHDAAARRTLADCFPDRDIAQVPALDIVAGGGGIHCITQQEPL